MDSINTQTIANINRMRREEQSKIGRALSKAGCTPASLGVESATDYARVCDEICDEAARFVEQQDARGVVVAASSAIEHVIRTKKETR